MAFLTSASTPLAAAVRMRTSGGAPATARLSMLGSGALSGRVAVMQAVVASPGGGPVPLSRRRCNTGDQSPPSTDLEYFLEEMKKFRPTTRAGATAKTASPSGEITAIAQGCLRLLEELLREYNNPQLPADTLKEVCNIGKSFLEVEAQCNYGSVRDDSIELAIHGLIRIAGIFPGELDPDEKYLKGFGEYPSMDRLNFRVIYRLVKSKYINIIVD